MVSAKTPAYSSLKCKSLYSNLHLFSCYFATLIGCASLCFWDVLKPITSNEGDYTENIQRSKGGLVSANTPAFNSLKCKSFLEWCRDFGAYPQLIANSSYHDGVTLPQNGAGVMCHLQMPQMQHHQHASDPGISDIQRTNPQNPQSECDGPKQLTWLNGHEMRRLLRRLQNIQAQLLQQACSAAKKIADPHRILRI